MTLFDLSIGKSAIVEKVVGDVATVKRLFDLGVNENKPIKIIRKAMFGDPIEIKVGCVYLAIRKAQAKQIKVKI